MSVSQTPLINNCELDSASFYIQTYFTRKENAAMAQQVKDESITVDETAYSPLSPASYAVSSGLYFCIY